MLRRFRCGGQEVASSVMERRRGDSAHPLSTPLRSRPTIPPRNRPIVQSIGKRLAAQGLTGEERPGLFFLLCHLVQRPSPSVAYSGFPGASLGIGHGFRSASGFACGSSGDRGLLDYSTRPLAQRQKRNRPRARRLRAPHSPTAASPNRACRGSIDAARREWRSWG